MEKLRILEHGYGDVGLFQRIREKTEDATEPRRAIQ